MYMYSTVWIRKRSGNRSMAYPEFRLQVAREAVVDGEHVAHELRVRERWVARLRRRRLHRQTRHEQQLFDEELLAETRLPVREQSDQWQRHAIADMVLSEAFTLEITRNFIVLYNLGFNIKNGTS